MAGGLLALGTFGRLLLAPGPVESGWRPAPGPRAAETLGEARRSVEAAVARDTEAARPLEPGEQIDVNRADETQLRRLPGVGPARAAAIVEDRREHGPFASPEDLARVPGVGPASVARWAGMATAGGVPSQTAPAGVRTQFGPLPEAIDLNRAQPNELEQITGIGPVLAQRIVAAREEQGAFRSVDELGRIPGIGPKLLEILRTRVSAP
ncbi:MAG: ComEA family DNA-binding protein [Gemmatimonadota bacterium]